MKVQKIDIKSEFIELRPGQDRVEFIKRPLNEPMIIEEGKTPPTILISAERITYMVKKVSDTKNHLKHFLVKVSDRDLFEELVEVSDATIQEMIARKTDYLNKKWANILKDELWRQKVNIKNRPFWDRLFNRF